MSGIEPALRKQLYEILSKCEAFNSDQALRTTFSDGRINHWLDRLPQSDSIGGRIDQTVSFLNNQYDNHHTNGLYLFLRVLVDRLPSKDARHHELAKLASQFQTKVPSYAPQNTRNTELSITVETGDIRNYQADVIALKFAQHLYGADSIVASALDKRSRDIMDLLPSIGYYKIFPSLGRISADHALFISVPTLYEFEYGEIRQFSRDVLKVLTTSAPQTQHLAMTIHGVGYGLDESEALRSQIAGYFDALETGFRPQKLQKITVVEWNLERAKRLRNVLHTILPTGEISLPSHEQTQDSIPSSYSQLLNTVGNKSNRKPYVFVIMPSLDDMKDIFFYGIQRPVQAAGYLCERSNHGDKLNPIPDKIRAFRRVTSRIETASFVLAELSIPSPDVYLELGYALGQQKPVLIAAREGSELPPVVQTQGCLTYKNIRDLEQALVKEIQGIDGVLR